MNIPKLLKRWRNKKASSQIEASKQLGVSFRTYQQWEQGRQSPRGLALKTILERIK